MTSKIHLSRMGAPAPSPFAAQTTSDRSSEYPARLESPVFDEDIHAPHTTDCPAATDVAPICTCGALLRGALACGDGAEAQRPDACAIGTATNKGSERLGSTQLTGWDCEEIGARIARRLPP